jgi:hypothetical protein
VWRFFLDFCSGLMRLMNFCSSGLLNHTVMRFLAALMYPQILLVYKTLFFCFLLQIWNVRCGTTTSASSVVHPGSNLRLTIWSSGFSCRINDFQDDAPNPLNNPQSGLLEVIALSIPPVRAKPVQPCRQSCQNQLS